MIFDLPQYSRQIAELCRDHHVRKLELFGSAATDTFDRLTSDVDFFVEFEDLGWEGSVKRYMGLNLGLEDLLGRPVDLIETSAITNRHFIETANKARELIFAA